MTGRAAMAPAALLPLGCRRNECAGGRPVCRCKATVHALTAGGDITLAVDDPVMVTGIGGASGVP